jgi:hypothetical protein
VGGSGSRTIGGGRTRGGSGSCDTGGAASGCTSIPFITVKYTSLRSGSTASHEESGGASPYTCTSVRPPISVVEMTGSASCTFDRNARSTPRRHTLPRSASTACIGSAARRMLPRSMMAMRVHSSLTSSTMCVERMTTARSPSSLRRLRKRARSAGSSPAVGSSTMISCGSPISATAIPKRCRIPPLKPSSRRARASHRLVWRRSAATVSRRSPLAVIPLRRAKWSSISAAVVAG